MTKSHVQVQRFLGQFSTQAHHFGVWLSKLSPAEFTTSCIVPGRRVSDIAALVDDVVAGVLFSFENPTSMRPSSIDRYFQATSNHRVTPAMPGLDINVARFQQRFERHMAELSEIDLTSPPAIVDTSHMPIRLVDVLRHALVSVVCYTDDMAPCCTRNAPPRLDRPALLTAVRTLAEVMAARHPGATVEVRIPGAIAIQLAGPDGGSTHTRGTPPNVIEMEPDVFLRLATRRLAWQKAKDFRLVHASGAHADLTPYLPVATV